MTENNTASIIIPCYNDGQYLRETLESAKAQTYPHCEIIIIDDKSTDEQTLELLKELKAEGYTVLRTAEGRKGAGAARNTGIEYAKGTYILPLDADDKIAPAYISKAVEYLQKNPDVAVCSGLVMLFGLKRGILKGKQYNAKQMLYRNLLTVTCVFYKKDWEAVGGYDEESVIEDYSFWISMLALDRKVYTIPEVCLYYRIRKGSRVTSIANTQKRHEAFRQLYVKNEEFFIKHGQDMYIELQDMLVEKERLQGLLSFKCCKFIFKLEIYLKDFAKKILGRA